MASVINNETAELDEITAELDRCKILPTPTDFVIKCEGREWNVHKFILTMNSTFFKAACTGEFKEAKQGFIELKEVDPECVAVLVSYFYTGDCNKPQSDKLDFHVQMCIMADKYDIQHLRSLAIDHFKEDLGLPSRTSYSENLCEIAKSAYGVATATKEIREHLIQFMVMSDFAGHAAANSSSVFEQMTREDADIATDFIIAQRAYCACVHEHEAKKRYRCEMCGETFIVVMHAHEKNDWFNCCHCENSMPGWEWKSRRED